jgi:arsenate reductase
MMTTNEEEKQSQKYRVIFLCTGNSCRSQMAEAIVNHQLDEQWHAVSAGTEPAGHVHPKALQVLKERGIEPQGESKAVSQFRGETFDLVITVCDHAQETCPLWLGDGYTLHRGYQDPAQAQGSEEEILAVFREVRDQIQAEIPTLLVEFQRHLNTPPNREEPHD